jgi:protein phosphatase-4 regulatory subunit 3
MFPRKDAAPHEAFLTYFFEHCCSDLFQPLMDLPEIERGTDIRFDRRKITQTQQLIELLYYCITNHTFKAAFYIQSSGVNKQVMSLLYLRDKPLRLGESTLSYREMARIASHCVADEAVVTRFLKSCLKTGNVFLIKKFVKNDLLAPLIAMLEEESRRDNMLTSACMTIFDELRKVGTGFPFWSFFC